MSVAYFLLILQFVSAIMRVNFKYIYLAVISFMVCQTMSATVDVGTPVVGVDTIGADTLAIQKGNLFDRVIAYFGDTNKERKDKAFDVSFIGGPHYSNEKKFGIGLLAAGVYSTCRGDTMTPPSNVSLYADVSTSGFYSVGVRSTTRFRQDWLRIGIQAYFQSMPDKFWGIGYGYDSNDDNETSYKRLMSECKIDALVRIVPGLYVGPLMELSYIKGSTAHEDMLYLWQGESMRTFSYALGAKICFDTRDNLTAPTRGVNLSLVQRYYGKWMANTYPFSSTELTASMYVPAWRDCTLAMQYHTLLTYGDTPWGMLASMGGSYTMRGYYEGRYRDKGEMDFTLELRQRVYRRVGVVAWGGVGSVFPRLSEMTLRHLLPNYGVGFRWEFKKNVNVRFDVGFGKGERGFVFNINEAF